MATARRPPRLAGTRLSCPAAASLPSRRRRPRRCQGGKLRPPWAGPPPSAPSPKPLPRRPEGSTPKRELPRGPSRRHPARPQDGQGRVRRDVRLHPLPPCAGPSGLHCLTLPARPCVGNAPPARSPALLPHASAHAATSASRPGPRPQAAVGLPRTPGPGPAPGTGQLLGKAWPRDARASFSDVTPSWQRPKAAGSSLRPLAQAVRGKRPQCRGKGDPGSDARGRPAAPTVYCAARL